MWKIIQPVALLATALVPLLHAMPAQAQTRVFVAAQGSDSNSCTFAAPCRTFQHAHDVVAPNGEIDVLDPAGYGAVNITKSVSIQGHGFSGITVTSGNAISINAAAGDKINLRGLVIEGFGTGSTGLVFHTGRSLVLENLVVRNFAGNGMLFSPSALSSLIVSSTIVADNAGFGILVQPSGNFQYQIVFTHVEAYNNATGGLILTGGAMAGGQINGFAVDCIASDSSHQPTSSVGFGAEAGQASVDFQLMRSSATGNHFGASARNPGARVTMSQTIFTGNFEDWLVNGGTLITYGDNVAVFTAVATTFSKQ
jgi:hypothetical protein